MSNTAPSKADPGSLVINIKEIKSINQNKNILYQQNTIEYVIWEMVAILFRPQYSNTLSLQQNCYHFADNILKFIFLHENLCILIKIPLKFFSKGTSHNKSSLVQVMAWCPFGTKPLSEPMMTQFINPYICLIQP